MAPAGIAVSGGPRPLTRATSALFNVLAQEQDASHAHAVLERMTQRVIASSGGAMPNRADARGTGTAVQAATAADDRHASLQADREALAQQLQHFTPEVILSELLGPLFIHPNRLVKEELLGEGTYAAVHAARLLPSEAEGGGGLAQAVAVKQLKPAVLGSSSDLKDFLLEVNVLRKLRHPHIIGIRGIGAAELGTLDAVRGSMYVVMEAGQGGTLRALVTRQMTSRTPVYTARQAVRWAAHVASAMHYLHAVCKPMIIHRDLKLDNVLLTDGPMDARLAKLADFGLHKRARLNALTGTLSAPPAKATSLALLEVADSSAQLQLQQSQLLPPAALDEERSYYGGNAFYANTNPSVHVVRAPTPDGSVHKGIAGALIVAHSLPPPATRAEARMARVSSLKSMVDLAVAASSPVPLESTDKSGRQGRPDVGGSVGAAVHGGDGALAALASASQLHAGPGDGKLPDNEDAEEEEEEEEERGWPRDRDEAPSAAPLPPGVATLLSDPSQLHNLRSLHALLNDGDGSVGGGPAALPPAMSTSSGRSASTPPDESVHRKMLALMALDGGPPQQQGPACPWPKAQLDPATSDMAAIPEDRVRISLDVASTMVKAGSRAAPPGPPRPPPAPSAHGAAIGGGDGSTKGAFFANATRQVGSLMYMAPELVEGEGAYNQTVDVFSFGIMLFELFSGKLVACKAELMVGGEPEVWAYVERRAAGERERIPARWPPALRDLVVDCWAQKPGDRPSFKDILGRLQALEASGALDSLIPSAQGALLAARGSGGAGGCCCTLM